MTMRVATCETATLEIAKRELPTRETATPRMETWEIATRRRWRREGYVDEGERAKRGRRRGDGRGDGDEMDMALARADSAGARGALSALWVGDTYNCLRLKRSDANSRNGPTIIRVADTSAWAP
ncbi:hypothetical protein CBR_g26345 [Chara braunii]|uniref:Uncharacterized protein n=1 Tax=Chara braunii TaxID=69332 RepID=A0A388L7N8_CHABU|nr:hypothetical protein CBR_g26345 [Chara braunii]|eukprot:GBG78316.1 hypothetical protein CBR_g26345 [Chara braunii]